jgi:hypothetical protein
MDIQAAQQWWSKKPLERKKWLLEAYNAESGGPEWNLSQALLSPTLQYCLWRYHDGK